MYGVFGNIRAQPGQREELLAHLLRGAAHLEELDSCYLYVVSRDPDDPDGLWVNEVWRSQADHQASLQHPEIQGLIVAARPLIAAMPVRIETIPLGGKGLRHTAG